MLPLPSVHARADAADAVWAFFDSLGSGAGGDLSAGGKLSTTDSWTCVSTLTHPSPVQGLAALGVDSFLTVSENTVRVWRLEVRFILYTGGNRLLSTC